MSAEKKQIEEQIKEGELIQLGLHDDLPEEQYHKSPGISKHGLDMLNQSPAHYIVSKSEPWEPTQPMIVGSAFHCLTLEPHKFDERFVVNTIHKDFKKQVAKDWREEQRKSGKAILSQKEYDNCRYMVEAIRNHPRASILCDPDMGKAEVSGYWIDKNRSLWEEDGLDPTNRLCRMRIDFINEAHNLLVDLKKAECAGMSKFARQIHNYRYHVQHAFYMDGFRQVKGGFNPQTFIFVVVEPEPPYAIGLYELAPKDVRLGRQIYKRDLQRYHECMTNREWPAYDDRIRSLELPKYAEYLDYY